MCFLFLEGVQPSWFLDYAVHSLFHCFCGFLRRTIAGYHQYRIAGYFRGVLIFVIFVVHQVRNFPPTKIYPRAFQIWTGDVLLWLFSLHLRLIDSVLDTQGPLSQQAVPRVMAKEVNREL